MIKKIILGVVILAVIVLAGWKLFFSKSDVSKKLDKVKEELTAYHMEANMDLTANEETRSYFVTTDYMKKDDKDFFRVAMLDKNINQTQIMLKNEEGVYVLTPLLNQVYKFKGDWPLNSPKPYLYHSLLDNFDKDHEVKKMDDGYLVSGKATYPNSPEWVKQDIKFSPELKPLWVDIKDESNTVLGKVTFTNCDLSPKFSDDFFQVESNMKQARDEMTEPSEDTQVTFNDLPLLPAKDTETLQEKTVSYINGSSYYIMTFAGKNNFTMVQGIAEKYDEMKIIDVDMEYVETVNGVAFKDGNRLVYQKNGVTYDIYSDTMTIPEIISVVNNLESYEKK
ncbi:MAG TPA: hypothetical protein DCY93_00745 [Firmicutes bacterium]|nr:hypothetical protein [Bacillota bacterium]